MIPLPETVSSFRARFFVKVSVPVASPTGVVSVTAPLALTLEGEIASVTVPSRVRPGIATGSATCVVPLPVIAPVPESESEAEVDAPVTVTPTSGPLRSN